MAGGTLNGDLSARDRDQGSFPLLVSEAGGPLEDDSGATVQLRKVESGSSWDSDVVKGNCRAAGLSLDNGSSVCESAAAASLVEVRRSGQGRYNGARAEKKSSKRECNHFDNERVTEKTKKRV